MRRLLLVLLLFVGGLALVSLGSATEVRAQVYGCGIGCDVGFYCDAGVCVPDASVPYCGDGNCDSGEGPSWCPQDCPVSPPGSGGTVLCGTVACPNGQQGLLLCERACSGPEQGACWSDCPPGGGGFVPCSTVQDCVDGGASLLCVPSGCGSLACSPEGSCYSDCSSCSNPGGGGGPPGVCYASGQPSLLGPQDGVELDASTVNLNWAISTWGDDAGQTPNDNTFQVEFAVDGSPFGTVCYLSGIADTSLSPYDGDPNWSSNSCFVDVDDGLAPGHTYSWYVITNNGCSVRNSPVWSFSTKPKGDLYLMRARIVPDADTVSCTDLQLGTVGTLFPAGSEPSVNVASLAEGGGDLRTLALSKPGYAAIDGVNVWDDGGPVTV